MDPITSAQAIKALLQNLGGAAGKGLGMAGKGIENGLGAASRGAPGLGSMAGHGLARGADLAAKHPKLAGGLGLGAGALGLSGLLGGGEEEDGEPDDQEYEELLEQLKHQKRGY